MSNTFTAAGETEEAWSEQNQTVPFLQMTQRAHDHKEGYMGGGGPSAYCFFKSTWGLFFVVFLVLFFENQSCYVFQVGLTILDSSNPPVSAF